MAPLKGTSSDPDVAAVDGRSSAGHGVNGVSTASGTFGVYGECATGHGVHGKSTSSRGVAGVSESFQGVYGHSESQAGVAGESNTFHGVYGIAHDVNSSGVYGTSDTGHGVSGVSTASGTFGVYGECATGHGVHGKSSSSRGVAGFSESYQGVYGHSESQAGVAGESNTFHGVYGIAHDVNSAGLYGTNDTGGPGVIGDAPTGTGPGVSASSKDGAGVSASSQTGEAVHAATTSDHVAAVAAYSLNAEGTGAAIYGKKDGDSGHAGYFDGAVHVTRVLTVDMDIQLTGADLAEEFEVVGELPAEAGSVVVLAGDDRVTVSDAPYDRRVAGVVSGAGNYRPALVLDSQAGGDRRPLALSGKVWCNVDADCAPVALGDLLTTSPTPGHAMRAVDPARAFGAVIGKALGSLPSGQGLLPVLVALQ